jgi:hypothetical protein
MIGSWMFLFLAIGLYGASGVAQANGVSERDTASMQRGAILFALMAVALK